MAAWTHTSNWDAQVYARYRDSVSRRAPELRGHSGMDCADLSILLLINFAAYYGLPLTFWDGSRTRYISKGTRQTPEANYRNRSWSNRDEYLAAVTRRVGTQSLWEHNTILNPRGPEPGDLMIAYTGPELHHASLVYRVYPPGVPHPQARDARIPDFPSDPEEAIRQQNQTEYFRSRTPDAEIHIDYLNYRGLRKDSAELIYFANARAMQRDGFQFRTYRPGVIDNWRDWNGSGDPPR